MVYIKKNIGKNLIFEKSSFKTNQTAMTCTLVNNQTLDVEKVRNIVLGNENYMSRTSAMEENREISSSFLASCQIHKWGSKFCTGCDRYLSYDAISYFIRV